jgi:translation initiation factor 3 subunit C
MNETIAKQKVTPAGKKMNTTNARGLNAVKQRIKKNNKDYQEQIDAFRQDKNSFMVSDEEEPAPKPTKVKFAPVSMDAAEDDDEGFVTMGKGGKALQFTPESILKHLRTIMESRGKKNTDRVEQIKIMEKLNEVANTPYHQIRVLMTLISARFDLGSGAASSMPLEHWKAAEKELAQLIKILDTNRDHVVIEDAEEWEDDDKAPVLEAGQQHIKIPGSVVSYVERLDDELTRSLQSIDPHTSEYIERLTDEGLLYNIIFQTQLYYEMLRKDGSLEVSQDSLNRVVQRRLDHVYFKVFRALSTILPAAGYRALLLIKSNSLRKLSRFWKRTPGRLCQRISIRQLPPATRPLTQLSLSMFSAITSSLTVTVESGPAQCCARFTSWRCMTITTRLAT